MIAWFICPYKRRDFGDLITRYCAINDFASLISSDGGQWAELEVLGDRAIVKVNASSETLSAIALVHTRIPLALLNDPLNKLTNGQRNAISNQILDMGYSLQELQNRFSGNLSNFTLGDVLRFAAQRRKKPRYDKSTDKIVFDGPEISCDNIDLIDKKVKQ